MLSLTLYEFMSVCFVWTVDRLTTHIPMSLCVWLYQILKVRFHNTSCVTCISNQSNIHLFSFCVCVLSTSFVQAPLQNSLALCLGSRPHSSLLLTNEPASASRFPPTPTSPATPLSSYPSCTLRLALASTPIFHSFSTLFRHSLSLSLSIAFLVAEKSTRLAVCWVGSGKRRRKAEK